MGDDEQDLKPSVSFWALVDLAGLASEGTDEKMVTEFINLRAQFARQFGKLALNAYTSGELDLLQTLHWVSHAAGSSCEEERQLLLGDVALRAIAFGKAKQLNASRPRYPKAIKDFAVDLVFLVKANHPQFPLISTYARPKKSVIGMVVVQLAIFGICPPPPPPGIGMWDRINGRWDFARRQGRQPKLLKPSLPHRTLHRWYLERAHSIGAVSPRGRQRR